MNHHILSSLTTLAQSLVLFSASTFLAVSTLEASPLEQGLHAYHNGDYETALRHWQPLAARGHDEAQLYVAFMLRKGKGVNENPALAAKWYRAAAIQGNASAQQEFGLMQELGIGMEASHEEAIYWYGLAEKQGYCPGELDAGGILGEE